MAEHPLFLRIAVPSPLRRLFDYLPPKGLPQHSPALQPGVRVSIPFGRGQTTGVLMAVVDTPSVAPHRLKRVRAVLDDQPILDEDLMWLARWAADYYHHPPGEVITAMLPVLLRQGQAPRVATEQLWQLCNESVQPDDPALQRAPRQSALLALLRASAHGLTSTRLNEHQQQWREPMARLVAKGWVRTSEINPLIQPGDIADRGQPPELNAAQAAAVERILASRDGFQPCVLDGVTGSGKTEVYLAVLNQVLGEDRQALVLVPEISLTPQLVERFRARLRAPVTVMHSGLTDQQRLGAWLAARSGEAGVIIGTRSAVFTPLARPGLIIIDEEHDASLKQQEGFRYSARDLAIVRAHRLEIPIVLGSATPSLESMGNVAQGRFQDIQLPERAGAATHPSIQLLDVRHQPMTEGVSRTLLDAMRAHLARGEQVLLFLNRRGYAPTLLCHDCGWVAACQRCDAHMTFHRQQRRLRCHHCGAERSVDEHCPQCASTDLRNLGYGTERITHALSEQFPDAHIVRVDRDTTRRKGALEALLSEIGSGKAQILVGTQMLAKGHDFPKLTLVGVLDADQGLYSADFRASERMAQLILQVAGRAGRAEHPGKVLIQTHHPDHPVLQTLLNGDYHAFAERALAERREAQLPPFAHLALIRAEAPGAGAPMDFLGQAQQLALACAIPGVDILGPVPSPMERRAGRYRAQLLLQARQRRPLHELLHQWIPQVEAVKSARKVRWSVDVDPLDMF